MKQPSFQFPASTMLSHPEQKAVQTSTPHNQPVTWQMNESEASYFSEMLNQSITSSTSLDVLEFTPFGVNSIN